MVVFWLALQPNGSVQTKRRLRLGHDRLGTVWPLAMLFCTAGSFHIISSGMGSIVQNKPCLSSATRSHPSGQIPALHAKSEI